MSAPGDDRATLGDWTIACESNIRRAVFLGDMARASLWTANLTKKHFDRRALNSAVDRAFRKLNAEVAANPALRSV